MTAIHSNFAPINRADQLGSALQQGLPRPLNPKLSWSLIHTLIVGGVTGGIAPLLVLPGRFKDFVQGEQMQYWHLAEWMRLQGGGRDADAATVASQKIVPYFWLPLFARIFTIVAIGIGVTALRAEHYPQVSHWQSWTSLIFPNADRRDPTIKSKPATFHEFLGAADRNGKESADATVGSAPVLAPSDSLNLVLAFDLAITGACICWLMQINGHVARVQRFISSFNGLTNHYGVGPVRAPGWQLGIRPVWLIAAAAMCAIGAFWAVPMLLATAAQRNYVVRTTRRLRNDLARRQRDVLLCQRPALHVPTSTYITANCSQSNCRAPLPPEALFCRRCGTKVQS